MKRIITLALILALVLALVACSAPASLPEPTPTPTESPDSETETQDGQTEEQPEQKEEGPGAISAPGGPNSGGEGTIYDVFPDGEEGDDIIQQVGGSWFLVVNDSAKCTLAVQAATMTYKRTVVIMMQNMDPESLQGEGEYTGLYYSGIDLDASNVHWNAPVESSGMARNDGYANAKFMLNNTAADELKGTLTPELILFYYGSVTLTGEGMSSSGAGGGNVGAKLVHEIQTVSTPAGSCGRDVTVVVGLNKETVKGKLFSAAEMSQQMFDELKESLEEYVDTQLQDVNQAREEAEAEAAAKEAGKTAKEDNSDVEDRIDKETFRRDQEKGRDFHQRRLEEYEALVKEELAKGVEAVRKEMEARDRGDARDEAYWNSVWKNHEFAANQYEKAAARQRKLVKEYNGRLEELNNRK